MFLDRPRIDGDLLRIVAEAFYLARRVRAEMRQILRSYVDASIMKLIQSVREIVYGLCGDGIGHEFIINDCLFLFRRTVRLQSPFAAKIQELRELMVTLDLCRALMNGMAQFLVPSPAQQESCANSMAQFLKRTGERVAAALAIDPR